MATREPQDPIPLPNWAIESIEIADYDPAWADNGAQERDRLQQLLAPWLTGGIEHVGSTAIPGLAAKPILDLQAPTDDLEAAGGIATILTQHHWHYVPPHLDHRPHRRFFVKVIDDRRVAHLHLMTTSSIRWQQQLAFRDMLRADPELVQAYAQLKTRLAERHRNDRDAYTGGKQQFINDVLARNHVRSEATPETTSDS